MDFKEFCDFLEEIKSIKPPKEKYKFIANKFKIIRDKCKQSGSFFQIFRLMLPSLDRERDSYNMKEAKVARILIKMLDLPAGNDRNVLSKSYLMAHQATDFGDVVHSVIRKYLSNLKTSLTINELNVYLDELTKRKNERDGEEILLKIFKKCSPDQTRWVIRIILKDLKLGIGANSILNCFHQDAAKFYASNNNLKKVCDVLQDESVRLHELDIKIFEPFRPMLSKKIDASNFKKCFPDSKLFYIENKFDGERFQLHMNNNEFQYFSRNGFNYSDNLGKTYNTGILTPKLKGLISPHVVNVILDGELMIWNRHTKKFGSKGMTLDVKKLNDQGPYQPCLCIYDIIFLNDKILTNDPLKRRLQLVKSVFISTKEGVVHISEVKEVSSRQEIIDELNCKVNEEEEGIIIKDPESVYKYSDRNSGWYKMKLEYFQDVMNDLDLMVMGGNYEASTSDKLNSFFVGIRSGNAPNGKPLYLSLGKVSSGLNYEELLMLNKLLKTEGKKYEYFDSENLRFGKDVPHYYIDPEKSIVFTIRASELVRDMHNAFKTHYTLRFPRVLQVRNDKPVDECLTMNELLELTQDNKSVIKLNKRNIELDEVLKTRAKKIQKKEIIMPKFYDTTKVLDILEGYNILVLLEDDDEKEKLHSLIKKTGGTIKYLANNKLDILLTSERKLISHLIKKRPKYDIINAKWIYRVVQDGNLLGYNQDEVFYIGWSYKNCLGDELDKYGDSFEVETNVDSLKKTFQIISDMGDTFFTNGTIKLKGKRDFTEFNAYFDRYLTPLDQTSKVIYDSFLDEIEFKYYGGKIKEDITQDVNIIITNGGTDRKKILENYLNTINRSDITIKDKHIIYE